MMLELPASCWVVVKRLKSHVITIVVMRKQVNLMCKFDYWLIFNFVLLYILKLPSDNLRRIIDDWLYHSKLDVKITETLTKVYCHFNFLRISIQYYQLFMLTSRNYGHHFDSRFFKYISKSFSDSGVDN